MTIRYYTRRKQMPRLKPGERVDFRKGKGYFIVPAPKPAPVPTPVPPAPTSLLKGRGMFTVERPNDCAGLRLDYILVLQETYRWETLDARAGVFQDESFAQFQGALASQHDGYQERALVTTLDGFYHTPGSWPVGWTMLVETYWNADGGKPGVGRSVPNMLFRARQVLNDKTLPTHNPALPDKWGTVPVIPVIGCYDASNENRGVGIRLTVNDYLPDLQIAMRDPCVVGYAMWRVETLAAEDRTALA